jgi:UDP-GlcNAc:undecaprenyl-phosphate GlcNAc-1-phosphate transferase
MLYHIYVLAFVVATGCAIAFTFVIRNIALAHGWTRPPASDHHIHRSPIPRLGGIAVYLSVFFVTAALRGYLHLNGITEAAPLAKLASLALPATIIFLAGLCDDIRPLRPLLKLSAQVLAGVLLFAENFRIATSHIGPPTLDWAISLVATIAWTILVTNAFNLIDGLDGLAAGSALCSTVTMFIVALAAHNSLVALLATILAGSTLGFLRYNFNPATIFLGDGGSQFLGFMLAALSLTGATQQKSSTMITVAVPFLAFGFPIFETGISILRRFISGQPIFSADRQHIHHKLLARGFSQRGAVVLLYGITAILGLFSVLLSSNSTPVSVVLVLLGIAFIVFIQRLGYHEFVEIGRIARRTFEQRPLIINNLTIRRCSEELSRAHDFRSLITTLETTFAQGPFHGFELALHGPSSTRLAHSWARATASHASWTITLDLISHDREPIGAFTLTRSQHTPLHLDVNLLTAELAPALVTAAQRLSRRSADVRPIAALAPMASKGQA